jgi:methylase of polypeptide subunit release factors
MTHEGPIGAAAVRVNGPTLDQIAVALAGAGIRPLALRAPTADRPAPYVFGDGSIELLIEPADFEAALRIVEPMSWRYSWVRSGLVRLQPTAYYWWDGGIDLTLHRGIPAAPLPASALGALTETLWQLTTPAPEGFLEPDPAALLVYLAVQGCRPGRGHEDHWSQFLHCREWIDDWGKVHAIARGAGVSRALGRALAAADAGSGRPGAGALFDGSLDMVWRSAIAIQRRALPLRFRRLLAGSPTLGDCAIRCRVGGVEVIADPGVFVPTPDADVFVDMTLEGVATLANPTIIEVGTGCGAIALALAHARPDATIHATDLIPAAVRSAKANARRLGLQRVQFYRGSVLDPMPVGLRGSVDTIIANLPFYPARGYASIGSVPRDTIQGAGNDGLDLVRQLARDAIPLLRPGGRLLLQMFARQWETMSIELAELGYRPGSARLRGPFAICPADRAG